MAWELLREEHPHFVVKGNAGEFKIHQDSLSPAQLDKMRAQLSGGTDTADAMATAGGKIGGKIGSVAGDMGKAAGQFIGTAAGHLAGQVAQKPLVDETNAFFTANPIPNPPVSVGAAVQRGQAAVDPSLISPEARAIPQVGQKLIDLGRRVLHFDEGGPVPDQDPSSQFMDSGLPQTTFTGYPNPDAQANPQMPPPEVAPDQAPAQANVDPSTGAPLDTDASGDLSTLGRIFSLENPASEAFRNQQTGAPAPMVQQASAAPQQGPPAPGAPAAPAFSAPSSGMVGPGGIMAASRSTEKALTERGQAEKFQNEILAKTQQQLADTQRQAGESLQQHYAANRDRLERMFADLQSPENDIKADHFWSSRSSWQKLSAGIGMVLSGIGSGLTGQPNMAAQFIQKAIEQDIDAQKANLGRKQGALAFFRDQMKDDSAAEQMTKAYMLNSVASEISAQATRNAGTMAAANGKVIAAQVHQASIGQANAAADQMTQTQLHKIQLSQATRSEQLIRSIFGGGGSPDQAQIKEAGARGLIKPVVVDRNGALGIARSDDDAKKLNDELPPLHAAADIVDRMQQLRNKEGAFKLMGLSDASDEYAKMRRELAVQIEKGLAGRVSDQTIHAQIDSIGGNVNEFWHKADPLSAVRQTLDAQHRSIVNQRTWNREGPNVNGMETAPGSRASPSAPAAQPPMPGAVHITDGARGGWLVPGKPMPKGWRPG